MPKRKPAAKTSKKGRNKQSRAVTSKKNTKAKTAKTSATRKAKFSPIPDGFTTVTPYLVVRGGVDALEFYKKAFGATEISRQTTPDGKLIHGRIKLGNSIVMLSDEFQGGGASAPTTLGTTSVTLHVYVDDVDHFWERALASGARIAMPLDNQFWGERYGQLVDPFGHRWSVSMQIEMDPEEMELKRKAAEQMFAQGEHPAEEHSRGEELAAEESEQAAGVG
jgi:PhnB protein